MKLFQIEEPEGGPADTNAPGAAIGIDATGAEAQVAVSVGGNAEILPDGDGTRTLSLALHRDLLLALRGRAEKQLARPVTHAVIALASRPQSGAETQLLAVAERAGLTVLRVLSSSELSAGASPALAAAILAEELAPRSPLPAAPDPG